MFLNASQQEDSGKQFILLFFKFLLIRDEEMAFEKIKIFLWESGVPPTSLFLLLFISSRKFLPKHTKLLKVPITGASSNCRCQFKGQFEVPVSLSQSVTTAALDERIILRPHRCFDHHNQSAWTMHQAKHSQCSFTNLFMPEFQAATNVTRVQERGLVMHRLFDWSRWY